MGQGILWRQQTSSWRKSLPATELHGRTVQHVQLYKSLLFGRLLEFQSPLVRREALHPEMMVNKYELLSLNTGKFQVCLKATFLDERAFWSIRVLTYLKLVRSPANCVFACQTTSISSPMTKTYRAEKEVHSRGNGQFLDICLSLVTFHYAFGPPVVLVDKNGGCKEWTWNQPLEQ